MPQQQQESSASYYARMNLRCFLLLIVFCLSITTTVDLSGYRPAQIESGLWWELPALVLCGLGVMKTK